MWKMLGSLLGANAPTRHVLPGKLPVEKAPEHIGIHLPEINGAFLLEDGLPRPQWDVVQAAINARTPAEMAEDWLAARTKKPPASPRERAWREAAANRSTRRRTARNPSATASP